jgi:hypothetical protein
LIQAIREGHEMVEKNENGKSTILKQLGQHRWPLPLVALAALGFLGWGLKAYFERDKQQETVLSTAMDIRQKIVKTLSDHASWQKTIEKNPSLDCLKNSGGISCSPQSATFFTLYGADGSLVLDPMLQGFRLNGELCQKNQPDCKIHINLGMLSTCKDAKDKCEHPDSFAIKGEFSDVILDNGQKISLMRAPFSIFVDKKNSAPLTTGGNGTVLVFKCPFMVVEKYENPMPSDMKCLPMECPMGFANMGISLELVGATAVGPSARQVLYAYHAVRQCLAQ